MIEQAADLVKESRDIWDQNAAFWDSVLGDAGNRFHRTIVEPAVLALLALEGGESVLEIACGNGAFARRMAESGVQILATDFSVNMLEHAQQRTHTSAVTYALVDATNYDQLLGLGEQRFDAAVCNMGLMDMPTIEPLLAALSRLLKPAGRFVFSVQHPCFNSNGATKTVDLQERDGEIVSVYAIKVAKYLTAWTERAVGIVGQDIPHYVFHRPISQLVNAGLRAGFVVDGFAEPIDTAEENASKWWAWSNYKETPPALVCRFRLK
jgi:ubiquinone/menaquinone biosynthesis C-methylase UbiE